MVGLVAIGALLRFYGLDAQSLWLDELFSRQSGLYPTLHEVITNGAAADVHPPGFPLLMYAVTRTLGDSEIALRLPSAIAGTATLYALYGLGRSMFSARIGLYAAALGAVHWLAIYYSQECRPYALLCLCVTLLAWLAHELWQKANARKPARKQLIAFSALCVAASYLHYFGLLFVAELLALLLALSLRRQLPARVALFPAACVLIAYLPWLSSLQAQATGRGAWMRPPTALAVWKTLDSLASGHAAWFLGLCVAGASVAMRSAEPGRGPLSERMPRKLTLLLAWAVIPPISAILISRWIVPVYSIRNLIVVLPAYLLLLALALDALDRSLFRGRPLSVLAVIALLLTDLLLARRYYATQTKEPLREVARQIEQGTARGEDPSVLTEPAWFGRFLDQCFALQGSSVRTQRADSALRDELWVVARKRALPPAPPGYEPVSVRVYEAQPIDLLRAWQITVAHYRRRR